VATGGKRRRAVQELAENMGLQALVAQLEDSAVQPYLSGVFPRDSMANMRFSINFFTAVGLGGLTVSLREDLKKAQAEMKEAEMQRQLAALHAGSGSSSSSSSGGGSSSGSESDSGSSSSKSR
jgi:pre-mRNA-splicing factor CWC22